MASSNRKAYLLKDAQIHFAFERNRDPAVNTNRVRKVLLYTPQRETFVHYPGESYNDQSIFNILEALQTEFVHGRGQNLITLQSMFHTFYQEMKLVTIAKFTERFIGSVIKTLAEPKISIHGKYKLLWHDCCASGNPWMLLDDQAHEFRIPAIELKENQQEYRTVAFEGASQMTKYYVTERLSDVRLKYFVLLEWKDFSVNAPKVQATVLDKLYADKVLANCVLVAATKEEFHGHRSIFAAQSPVFHTMLTSGMQESHTNRIELLDVSKESCAILLAYFYRQKINLDEIPDEVALELLQAGHKYDVSRLENVMLQMLSSKPADWFTMDNMIALYYFSVNLSEHDNYRMLMEKMMSIMRRNPNDLRSSQAYQKFIKKHPQAAADLLIKLLEQGNK